MSSVEREVRRWAQYAKEMNAEPIQQAALVHLRNIPEVDRRYFEFVTSESVKMPSSETLYLLQLLRWGVQQPEVKDEIGISEASDLDQTLERLMNQISPQLAMFKIGATGEDKESLLARLREANDPIDAALETITFWSGRVAES